jgi:AcrR family transcriptional regulator
MSQDDPIKKRRGRPPDERGRLRALAAARDILMSEGFGRLSMEAVAAKSAVSKPTLYRHWANAQELAMAALVADTGAETPAAGATAKERLIAQIEGLIAAFATRRGRQIAMTLASADPESEFTRAFRNRVILAGREAGRSILAVGVASGEISKPRDIEIMLDMLYGPVFYRLLVGHQPLDEQLGRRLVEHAWTCLAHLPG